MNLLEIQEALKVGVSANGDVKNLFAEARDPKRWQKIKTSGYYRDALADFRNKAVEYGREPLRSLPYSLFKLFEENGSRIEYEAEYFEHRARLNTFAILEMVDDNPEYLKALEDTIWAICDEYTWSLPAHLDDTRNIIGGHPYFEDNMDLQQKLAERRKTLDLFACETGFALAEILSLLEDKLAPMVVYRGRQEITERILEPYFNLATSYWWETATMNWAAVCAGSIGAAAMYLIEDERILARILQRVLGTISFFLKGFGDDGACLEGLGYWTYGFGYFTYFASLLKQRTGGKIDLFQNKKIQQIALFPQKCYLSGNHGVSFSDASLTENYLPGLMCFLKSVFSEVLIPERKYAGRVDEDRHRWAPAIRNIVWNQLYQDSPLPEGTFYLADAQWLISKKRKKDISICFAAKGGHNDEPHNHNDIGSFLLQVDEELLLVDMGRGEYTRQYFGKERYEFLCNSSRGHSVPVIEGEYQKPGREYEARNVKFQTSMEEDILVMDIVKAYDVPQLKLLQRKFVFKKSGNLHLVIQDDYEFEKIPSGLKERFVTFYQPQILSNEKARIQGVQSRVDVICRGVFDHFEMVKDLFITHDGSQKDVYFIDIIFQPTTTKITAEIAFEEVQI